MGSPTEVEEIKTKIDNGDVKVQGQRKHKDDKHKKEKSAKSPKPQVEAKAVFPASCKLNKYGFIYLNDDVLTAWLGHGKGTEVKLSVELKDGGLVVNIA